MTTRLIPLFIFNALHGIVRRGFWRGHVLGHMSRVETASVEEPVCKSSLLIPGRFVNLDAIVRIEGRSNQSARTVPQGHGPCADPVFRCPDMGTIQRRRIGWVAAAKDSAVHTG